MRLNQVRVIVDRRCGSGVVGVSFTASVGVVRSEKPVLRSKSVGKRCRSG